MNLHFKLRRNKKGIGTVFAMVFFLLIVMVVFASFMIILNRNTGLEQTVTQARQLDQDKANEQITINGQANYASANTVTVSILMLNNTGTVPVQLIRLWVQDIPPNGNIGNIGNLSLANPQSNIILAPGGNWSGSFSVIVPGSGSGDSFRFWFETARGNQFTLQPSNGGTQSSGGLSQADINQALSKVLGEFLPNFNSVQWAQIDPDTGVVIGQWNAGWQLPTTETPYQHGIMTVWKVDLIYYGNTTMTIGPNTSLSWTPLNAHDRETDEPFMCYIVNFNGNQISNFPLSGMQIQPSPNGTPVTLYLGAEDEFSTGPAPMGSINNYNHSGTLLGMEDEDEISDGASMTLNIYSESPGTYAQSFPLYIVGTRTYSISINPTIGNVGSTVTVTGTGFDNNKIVTLAYDGVTQATSPTTITTGAGNWPDGGFTATFTVPASTAGGHVVMATDADFNSAIYTFTVIPNLIITPTQGPNGTSVTASVTGFSANSNVNMIFGGAPLSTTPTPITTDITGSFNNAIFAVPNSAAGSYFVNATDTHTNTDYATFTVVASTISLNPSSGIIGTTVTVSGSNFLPNLPLTVTYDGATVAMSTSTGSGAVPSGVTFSVPPSTFGSHAVRVTDGYGNYAQVTFSVTASVSLNPQNGPVGTPVTVTGQGFGPSKTITITFAASPVATSPSPITTDNSGSFVASFTVPAGSTTSSIAGAKTVQANDGSNSASNTFTVTPFITLNPTSGNTGTVVTVSGTGYGPLKTVTIKYSSSTMTTTPGTVTTTPYGTFSCTFTVPASVAGGHVVLASDSASPSNSASASFTVAPNITLNPTSGKVGSTVTVTGTGFAANSLLSATFGGSSVTLSGTHTTDGSGNLPSGMTFTVPASIAGAQQVVVTDASSNNDFATFTVTSAVTVNPTSGNVGSSVTVSGTGFAPSSTVTITYDGTTQATSPATVTAGLSGSFSATIAVPASVVGAHTVGASDGVNSGSATFTVTQSISLSPSSGIVGSTVTVSGSGFAASKTVTVKFVSTTMVTVPSTVTSDAYGSFSCTFTVPAAINGGNTVTATDASANAATATFTVNPAITLSPTSGNVGITVTVSGTGFTGSSALTAKFNGVSVSLGGTTSTGATGSFAGATFTVPASAVGA
ncbi:MAG: hypothetical protein ABSA79_12195, partial [Candidatus Bathyarchaeia archaeon]